MSQELRVLQCFDCHIFQVDIVKKTAKWQCRVCNTKQSVRKELFRGTGKECRLNVQKLNMAKGLTNNETLYNIVEFLDEMNNKSFENDSNRDEFSTDNFDHNTKKWSAKVAKKNMNNSIEINVTSSSKKSKWDSYL